MLRARGADQATTSNQSVCVSEYTNSHPQSSITDNSLKQTPDTKPDHATQHSKPKPTAKGRRQRIPSSTDSHLKEQTRPAATPTPHRASATPIQPNFTIPNPNKARQKKLHNQPSTRKKFLQHQTGEPLSRPPKLTCQLGRINLFSVDASRRLTDRASLRTSLQWHTPT